MRVKTGHARTGPAAVVPSIGIKHAVLLNAVLLKVVTRIINRLTEDRAALHSMGIADPVVLRRAEKVAGLKNDTAGVAIVISRIVGRAVVRSTDSVVTVDRHHAEAVAISGAISGGRKAWVTVVVLRLTFRIVRRSRIVPELAGRAVVPR